MHVVLKEILTEDFIERFQESFAFATGFGVVFVDLNGNHIGEGSNFSKFCREINRTKEGAAYCANTNRKAIEDAMRTKKPSIYVCHAGLINIEIPLTYEGEYIGAFTAGQVLCSDCNQDTYPTDSELNAIPWLQTQEAKEYLKNIRTLTRQQIEATAVSLENIANYIIQTAMYNKLNEKLTIERNKRLEYEKKQIEMEHRLKLAELDALQKQVTPHFMFNVINSISRLISMEEYSSAKNMLDSFSQMLRYSLYNITSVITLRQELGYIENYLKIQKHRFTDRLEYEIEVQHDALNIKIPYFSLQPLVENAIIHGISPLEYGGSLKLICKKHKHHTSINIIDDGTGIAPDRMIEIKNMINCYDDKTPDTSCIGLRNCYRRFKLMYGDKVNFFIDSKAGKGTKVRIDIFE